MSKHCNTLYGLLFFVFGEISTLYTHYCTKSFLIPAMTLENRLFFSKLNSRTTFVCERDTGGSNALGRTLIHVSWVHYCKPCNFYDSDCIFYYTATLPAARDSSCFNIVWQLIVLGIWLFGPLPEKQSVHLRLKAKNG